MDPGQQRGPERAQAHGVVMPNPSTPMQDAIELQEACSALVSSIRDAIRTFRANPPSDSQGWPRHHTPLPWEERVLPNLDEYQQILEQAIRLLRDGDPQPLVRIASTCAGLAKDMDFDQTWMTTENSNAVDIAVDKVVSWGSRIRRADYAGRSDPRRREG